MLAWQRRFSCSAVYLCWLNWRVCCKDQSFSKRFSGGTSRFRIYLTAMPLWLDA